MSPASGFLATYALLFYKIISSPREYWLQNSDLINAGKNDIYIE